ncbi:MAG: hypothetical protein OEY34_01830 [Cyclobacteriaceae bacterium]|nr:hypothetical protein [Cyclobacteriaceae bacterium]
MDNFTIKGSDGSITISIDEVFGYPTETCHWGGYDTRSRIDIHVGNYKVVGELYISTGDIFSFYQKLKNCHKNLNGEAYLESYENNLRADLTFDQQGHVKISGFYQEYHHAGNKLTFEIDSDQTYFNQTISELASIVDKYGDMTGIKDQ